jgi:prepilin-type processing-associated H-X9-DG protein
MVALVATAVAAPTILRLRSRAALVQCADNLRKVALLGLSDFAQAEGAYPAGTVPNVELPPARRLSWYVPLLERLRRPDWAKEVARDAAWDHGSNAAVARRPFREVICPGALETPGEGPPVTNYVGLTGLGPDSGNLPVDSSSAGLFRFDAPTPLNAVSDGTGSTVGVVETTIALGTWLAGGPPTLRAVNPDTAPYFGPARPFGGCHPERTQFAMADGSVRTTGPAISPHIFEAMTTIAGGAAQPDEPP